MSDMMLYTHPHSRGVTVSWMLAECAQAHEVTALQFRGDMKSAAYLAINPAGKVPTLVHGDTVISETAAIVAYLADLHPEKRLAPAIGQAQRGEYYKWLFILCNQFEPALTDIMFEIEVTDDMRFALGYPEFAVLEQQVTDVLRQQPYLLGADFSAADILLAALLAWAQYKNVVVLNDTLSQFLQRVTARPAFIEAQSKNEALGQQMGL
ncbi:glutathione S-transferase family protein [Neisseriaceae bacterium CLB008]